MTNDPLDQATLEAVARFRNQLATQVGEHQLIALVPISDLRTILDALQPEGGK